MKRLFDRLRSLIPHQTQDKPDNTRTLEATLNTQPIYGCEGNYILANDNAALTGLTMEGILVGVHFHDNARGLVFIPTPAEEKRDDNSQPANQFMIAAHGWALSPPQKAVPVSFTSDMDDHPLANPIEGVEKIFIANKNFSLH